MTKLSVNVNKLATLRNSRGKNNPNVLQMALDIIRFGAEGITVHPRPDGRHIRTADVYAIAEAINVEFNIEGYPDENFLTLVTAVKPAQCTLVPDAPGVLTSNAGWKIVENKDLLIQTVKILHDAGIRTSLFIDPLTIQPNEIQLLSEINTDRVELYTEAYADAYATTEQDFILKIYQKIATEIHRLNIGINAGHDLNLLNLKYFIKNIPFIEEVSVGHALICDALYLGMKDTIKHYLALLKT